MTLSVSTRFSQPNFIHINGNSFELSYMRAGRQIYLSDEGWRKVQDVFIKNIQSEVGENFDLSSLQKVIISLDTHTLQAWDRSTSVFEKPLLCKHIAIATANQFTNIIEDHQTKKEEGKKTQQLHPLFRPPRAVKSPQLKTEDFATMCPKNPKKAMSMDFLGKFDLLHNESLAYYLSILSKKMDNSQILLEGDLTKTVFTQRALLDWVNGKPERRFEHTLTSLISSPKPVIYIPFNSPGHYQMIVINRREKQIIGYNSRGRFNTDDQLKIKDKLIEIFKGYTFIGDEAFPIDHYEQIEEVSFPVLQTHQPLQNDEHCGIYVIHFIHQIELNKDPYTIFQHPVSLETIQKIRKFCAREITNS